MKERVKAVLTMVKCLTPRLLFTGHMLFTIWSINCITGSDAVWAVMVGLSAFVFEAIYRIVKKKCREPKWFSPCICLYLLTIIPPIWILNLDLLHCLKTVKLSGNGTCIGLSGKDDHICNLFPVESYFSRKPLVYTLEEVMLLLLILGRWILPTTHLSREQLSQLLFVYFGISFDIMELFQLFEEPSVLAAGGMPYAILTAWSFSLIQFTIVLTVLKTRKPGLAPISETRSPLMRLTCCRCLQSGLWSLLTNLVVQDIPFLCLRLHCLIVLRTYSYNIIFYTFKNILVIVLQTYRFVALVLSRRRTAEEPEDNTAVAAAAASEVAINDIPSTDTLINNDGSCKAVLGHSTQQLVASERKDSFSADTRNIQRTVSCNALQRTASTESVSSSV